MVIRAALPPAASLHTPLALPTLEYQATYPRLFADPCTITCTRRRQQHNTDMSVTAAVGMHPLGEQAIRLQGHDPELNTYCLVGCGKHSHSLLLFLHQGLGASCL